MLYITSPSFRVLQKMNGLMWMFLMNQDGSYILQD